jgi:murein DD-endopeptidase MepM/ murein hydrolase activator NlpD
VARAMSKGQRARRYLQASMESEYTGLPEEHREAKRSIMREHERAYPGVRRHALAGTTRHFDKPLQAGERGHQRALQEREGIEEPLLREMRKELEAPPRPRRRAEGAGAGPALAGSAASSGLELVSRSSGGGRNTVLYFIGVLLGLSLIYLLVAGKGAKVITALTGTIVGGVRAFVSPVDPLAKLETALGATPISAAAPAPPSSGGAAAGVATVGTTGYVNPFSGDKNITKERIDQGQDFALSPGAPIRAIGPAKVLGVEQNWYQGQPAVFYQLTSGPAKGKVVYVAEQITPNVRAGQTLQAGQAIGTYARSGTGIETGWGTPSGQTLARATTGYVEGQATAAGKSFSSFLSSLGV